MLLLNLLVLAVASAADAPAASAAVAAAARNSAAVVAAYVAACGEPCALAGKSHVLEAGLTVATLSLETGADPSQPLLTWASTGSPSLLDTAGYRVRGSIYAPAAVSSGVASPISAPRSTGERAYSFASLRRTSIDGSLRSSSMAEMCPWVMPVASST